MKKRLSLTLASIALLSAVGYGATVALANSEEEQSHPMIQALAERFGLSETEVKEVFDEVHADHFSQIQTNLEERLDQAVEDGILTEEQKQALLNKKAEMRSHSHEHKEEMQVWFEEQGIDHKTLMDYMGGLGMHRKLGKMGKFYTK